MFDKSMYGQLDKQQKYSTPNGSGSNLTISNINHQMSFGNQQPKQQMITQTTSNNQNNQQLSIAKSNFMVSTIFQDQKILKEHFGIYELYGNIEARAWITMIKAYCNLNYQSPNEILDYFHIFLSNELKKWYLKLDASKKTTLDELESLFIEEVFDRECEYEELIRLKQNSFLAKMKSLFPEDSIVKESVNFPLSSFLKLKILTIRKVYPKICKEDAIRLSIFSIESSQVKKTFSKYLKSDLSDIISLAKSVDELN